MNTENPGRHRGQFRSATKSVPTPLVVDGSDWERAPGPRTTGTFVIATKPVPTPIVVDGSDWSTPRLAAVAQELSALLTGLEVEEQVKTIEALVKTLNEKHQLNVTLTRKSA